MSDSRLRRGDPPLRINEEESVGFHGDSRATGSGEQTDMKAVLEQLQRVSAQVEHMNQRMERLEVSQGVPNTRMRQEFHGGRCRGRGGRERPREEFEGENFGGDFEEGMDETFAVQDRAGHGRYRREETDGDLSNIKVNIPPFMGKSDPEAYLEWEERMEMIFDCHNYSESKKVKLAAMEFGHYALQWWINEQNTRRRVGEDLINTWRQMKGAMRKRFVPSHYHRLLHQRLQSLSQGSRFVEDYYKEMEMLMMRLSMNEDR